MGKREEAAMALLVEMPPGTVMSKKEGLRYVDAVIACIREPDEKMLAAGRIQSETGMKWQAMIDAIGD